MPADQGTRDETLAQEISTAEDDVAKLAGALDRLVSEATAEGAAAHAGLYAAVQGQLTSAAKALGRAHTIMLNGDPEDYNDD